MGCDIHCYVEYKKKNEPDNSWCSFGGRINPGRYYLLFERIAGVRGDVENALIKPRGIPDDLGFYSRKDWWLYIVDHKSEESGYCTREQARKYHQGGSKYKADSEGFVAWVEHPDWHTPTWLTPDEWQDATKEGDAEYHALLSAMRELERHGNDVRVVIWFDN